MVGLQTPRADDIERLTRGELTLHGRIPWSTNITLVGEVTLEGRSSLVIYKPTRGVRPLHDFEAETLCGRELAAYRLSVALGWPNIPATVLRDGPAGWGAVQQVVEADLDEHYFSLRGRRELREAFKRVAAFDELTNNADRKGGHVLLDDASAIWAIDHALCFHADYHLRTVIWEYGGEPFGEAILADLMRVRGSLATLLGDLLSSDEISATEARAAEMLARGSHGLPRDDWRNVPYPLV